MINKNDKLVIFLEEVLGVDVDFWSKRVVWREKTTSIPPPIKVVSVLVLSDLSKIYMKVFQNSPKWLTNLRFTSIITLLWYK